MVFKVGRVIKSFLYNAQICASGFVSLVQTGRIEIDTTLDGVKSNETRMRNETTDMRPWSRLPFFVHV